MTQKILHNIKFHFRWYVLLSIFILAIILFYVSFSENISDRLKVYFLNIGQGDSTLIISPTGQKMLIDGGPGKTVISELSSILPFWDRHIDAIIIDNADKDHYEGIISVLEKYKVDVVIVPGTLAGDSEWQVLEKEISDKKVTKLTAVYGEVLDLGGGVSLEVLFPDRDISKLSTNTGSIISRLVFGKNSVLFEGDAPKQMEEYVLSLRGKSLQSTILHTGHHGSKTSSSPEYVTAVSPEYAIISAGKDNSYGHPNEETLETLKMVGAQVLATCAMGRISFVSDGQEFVLRNKNIQSTMAGCKK